MQKKKAFNLIKHLFQKLRSSSPRIPLGEIYEQVQRENNSPNYWVVVLKLSQVKQHLYNI